MKSLEKSEHYNWSLIRAVAKDAGGSNNLAHIKGGENDVMALEIIEQCCVNLRAIFFPKAIVDVQESTQDNE